ncbi:MAG TPA: alpha/beta fold hydrolase [Ramlibacter sp.]|uniref:alpha/beta fold hydrolase n=1 Tax=Ramlibacter sp. TaxID=1917967 RepID=UPI002BF12F25|nr:alpha/beta fold hydrolase [Ramlibacter sp.]HVZ42556.1 alpha/beta fold hydrolase [Ramlibacter sp.]
MEAQLSRSGPLDAASSFYGASPGIRLVRLAMRAAQRVWPALAVRAAYRVFGTPLPLKWSGRGGAWQAGWRWHRWVFEDASITVYHAASHPEGPVALLVHGWGGNAAHMLPLADALAQHGFRPVLLEMPAHGASRGLVSNLPQFVRAIEYACGRLAQEGSRVHTLAAHSLAANAAAFAAARGLGVERLVLLAPPASPRAFTRYFAHVFGLTESTRAAMQERIETREAILLHQLEPASVGPRVRVPTLVVHDRGDNVNRFADGQAYAHTIRGAQLLATEGLGHRRILKDARVLARVALFSR